MGCIQICVIWLLIIPNLFEEEKGVVAEGFIKDRNFFISSLPNQISYKYSSTLKKIMKNLINDMKNDNMKKVILFSPCAASFDQFKNFEERGNSFNNIIALMLKKIRI